MMNYNFSTRRLIALFLPSGYRRPRMVSLLAAYMAGFERLRSELQSYIAAKRYEMRLTGQVVVMEGWLNDALDYALRRVRIIDGERVRVVVWYGMEGQPPVYVYAGSEVGDSPRLRYASEQAEEQVYDFLVELPSVLAAEREQVRAMVNQYKLAGKRFQIILV